MDLQQLCGALQACMSPNMQERQAAEAALKQNELSKGQIVNLLRVAAEESVDPAVRQVAAISFKNTAKRNWEPQEGQPCLIHEEDKAAIRDNLMEAMVRAPHAVMVQLGEVFKAVVLCDHPDKWPGLLDAIMAQVTSPEQARVYGGLFALRILARKYEFRDEEERGPLTAIVNTTFPVLLQIFQQLLANPSPGVEVAEFMKLVLKVFWSATYMGIPDIMLSEQHFTGWLACLHQAILKPVPEAGQPADPGARKAWPWWKAKKWVLHIAFRLFSCYSVPKACKEGNDRAFAAKYKELCLPQFMEAHLRLMEQHASGTYLSPRVVNLALQFLTQAVEVKDTYGLIKPHVEPLLYGVVFPLLCYNDEDDDEWRNDPQEYIRKGYDLLEEIYSTKTAATNFVTIVCQRKPKAFLDKFMAHVVRAFNAYKAAAAAGPVAPEQARAMDGALLAVGALNDVLKEQAQYKGQLEAMLQQYVAPCFSSPYGHLRAKACWVAGNYTNIEWANKALYGQLLQAVMACLNDGDLPVQVDAVVALRAFIDDLEDMAPLKPVLKDLMAAIFNLMNKVDTEDLVFTLETIVEKFGDEIGPWALELAANLGAAFWKYSGQGEEEEADEFEEENAGIAAYGCIKALNTLLESVASQSHLFPALEELLFPIMQKNISTDGQDVFEEVLEMLAYFTYFSASISPRLWSLWPQIHAQLMEWGIDYWENCLVPLDNFICKGTEVFLSCKSPDYLASVYQMVHHALTGDFRESDVVAPCRLLEVVLQNCRGRVDQCVGPYVQLVTAKLATAKGSRLKDALLTVLANALYYHPGLALAALQQCNCLQVFNMWFSCIFERKPGGGPKHFKRMNDMKVCLLGLTSLLALPALPAELEGSLPQLMSGIIKLLLDLKQQQEAAEAAAAAGSDDEDEEEEEEEEFEEDEDGDHAGGDAADEAYLKALTSEKISELLGGDDSDDEFTEDDEVATPLDGVSAFTYFAQALGHLQGSQPGRYQALMAGLDGGARGAVEAMMQHAAAEQQRAAQP